MNSNLISRYIWLVDTLSTYGRLSRQQISKLWKKSYLSNGEELPERTFFHYRRAIEEIFKIEIGCDGRGEYYIDKESMQANRGLTSWLLDSFAVGNILSGSEDISSRVEIEAVPSAREFLPQIVNALRERLKIRFDYAGFNRSRTERGIDFEPYFLKRYKQRWYMLGYREKDKAMRTYALDRIKGLVVTGAKFDFPEDLTLADAFGNILGVTSTKADIRTVKLQTTRTQAKYFRALPLHHSQTEELTGEDYSIFSFRLQLNYELVHEILGLGDSVKVLEPKELRLMVVTELKKTLSLYEPD